MEMKDDYGHAIFESIKITLVCGSKRALNPTTVPNTHLDTRPCADDCLATDHPEKCRHKLASMPRWLSSKKVETVRALLAGARAAFPTLTGALLILCPCLRAQRTQLCCARHSLPRL